MCSSDLKRLAVKGLPVALHQRGGGDEQPEAHGAAREKAPLGFAEMPVGVRAEVRHRCHGQAVFDGHAVVEDIGLKKRGIKY